MTYSNFSDERLCALLIENDQKALQAILVRYWEPLYKMAAYTLEDTSACEDIVQELFIKIWNNRKKLNFSHSLKAYLFASVRYEVYRQVKIALKKDFRLASKDWTRIEDFNPQNKLEYEELMSQVEQIVNTLPDRCRKIYELSRHEQLSHKEIATQLNITTKTIENQLTIALKRIKGGLNRILIILFL